MSKRGEEALKPAEAIAGGSVGEGLKRLRPLRGYTGESAIHATSEHYIRQDAIVKVLE